MKKIWFMPFIVLLLVSSACSDGAEETTESTEDNETENEVEESSKTDESENAEKENNESALSNIVPPSSIKFGL